MIERLRKALADEEVAAIICTEDNVETLDALLSSWPACFTDESEEALVTLLRAIPALLDAAEALEGYAKQCPQCFGRGSYTEPCPYCGDSTYDHECPDETVTCAACAPARRALAALEVKR